jgi:threonine/homoserine/homoserine lactone efflux protein
MLSLSTLSIYIPAVLLMVVTPGPAILFTLNRSLSFGRRAGFVTAAGLLSGTCVLFLCAALGLTAVLRASGFAYGALKIVGALYLAFLGVRTILAAPAELRDVRAAGSHAPSRRYYLGGVTTELLNPKTAMFYVSVLPQFVDVNAGHVIAQLLLLGGIFVVFAAWSLAMVIMSSTHVRALLVRHPRYWSVARWITGCVFIGSGARLAFDRR